MLPIYITLVVLSISVLVLFALSWGDLRLIKQIADAHNRTIGVISEMIDKHNGLVESLDLPTSADSTETLEKVYVVLKIDADPDESFHTGVHSAFYRKEDAEATLDANKDFVPVGTDGGYYLSPTIFEVVLR